MANGITGTTFDRMRVRPLHDAALYNTISGGGSWIVNDYNNNLDMTKSGLNLTIDTGAVVHNGRFIEVTEPITISLAPNVSGYIAIVIDLTQQNTSTGTPGQDDYTPVNNQVSMQFVTEIIKQLPFKNGNIQMMSLAKIATNTTTITELATGGEMIKHIGRLSSAWDGQTSDIVRFDDCGDVLLGNGYIRTTVDIPAVTDSVVATWSDSNDFSLAWRGLNSQTFTISHSDVLYSFWLDMGGKRLVLMEAFAMYSSAIVKVPKGASIRFTNVVLAKAGTNGRRRLINGVNSMIKG